MFLLLPFQHLLGERALGLPLGKTHLLTYELRLAGQRVDLFGVLDIPGTVMLARLLILPSVVSHVSSFVPEETGKIGKIWTPPPFLRGSIADLLLAVNSILAVGPESAQILFHIPCVKPYPAANFEYSYRESTAAQAIADGLRPDAQILAQLLYVDQTLLHKVLLSSLGRNLLS